MKHARAAKRYAKAVMDLALEKNATSAVERDMRLISKTISDRIKLRQMLSNPVIQGSTKKKTLEEVFSALHGITEGLLSVLVENKRLGLLNEVALKFIILNDEIQRRGVAYVTTAIPLSGEMEKKALKEIGRISDKELTIKNIVDGNILGGFVLRIGDLQYDASIASRLNSIKREFTKR